MIPTEAPVSGCVVYAKVIVSELTKKKLIRLLSVRNTTLEILSFTSDFK